MKNILNEKKKKYFEIKNKKKSGGNQNSVQNENNIFIFNNINQYNYFCPNNINLLDNYNIIQYKNIKIPRIPFTNSINFDNYKKTFTEIYEKINTDYKKDIFNLKYQYPNNNIITNSKNENILFHKECQKQQNNNYNNIEFNKSNIIIELNNNNKNKEEKIKKSGNLDIFQKKDIMKKKCKKKRQIFNLKHYDKNKNLICKKRGKKPLNQRVEHFHSALDNDNILRKIQVHFLTFLVSFTNDYIDAIYKNDSKKKIPHFRNFDYQLKKLINQACIEKMKTSTIGEILQMKASRKNKLCDIDINKITYNNLCQQYPDIKNNYFNKCFKEFFIEYYYNKIGKNITLNGVNVNLSIRTQNFSKLIRKNINYNNKFRNIATCFYLNNQEEKELIKDKGNNEMKEIFKRGKPLFIVD